MKSRVNKLINWHGKEYAHIIEDAPFQFCDICVFSKLCSKVLHKELAFEDSPMPICERLCDEANTHFAFFIGADKVEYYDKINKVMEDTHVYFWNDETDNERIISEDVEQQLQQEQTSSENK